eukprot:7378619-Prymnesium_polylepis.1
MNETRDCRFHGGAPLRRTSAQPRSTGAQLYVTGRMASGARSEQLTDPPRDLRATLNLNCREIVIVWSGDSSNRRQRGLARRSSAQGAGGCGGAIGRDGEGEAGAARCGARRECGGLRVAHCGRR